MLTFDHATYRVGAKTLVHDLSLEVAAGGLTALVGPNGAGKSTLLRLASGEAAPSAGAVSFLGQPVHRWDAEALARHRAVLPQDTTLSFGFRVLDVVLFGRAPHHRTSTRAHDLALAHLALAEAEVAHLADRIYTTLSGGERQRVHLARALAQLGDGAGPHLLLLDEPTASLDLAHQHTVLRAARRRADQGAAVLVVLHDLNLAAQYADRLAVLADGRLLAVGPPDAVLTPDLIQTAFGMPVLVIDHPCHACPLVLAA